MRNLEWSWDEVIWFVVSFIEMRLLSSHHRHVVAGGNGPPFKGRGDCMGGVVVMW